MASPKRIAAIVTTKHKGVFFGYVRGALPKDDVIRIEDARMVYYWSADVRSVVGLAATGPTAGCKVSLAAPAITLRDVTAAMECSAESVTRFEAIK